MVNTSREAYQAICALTPRQQEVLGAIAINEDGGHHPRTLKVLVEQGLIDAYTEPLGGRFPLRITRYRVPIFVHLAWCWWATQALSEEERASL